MGDLTNAKRQPPPIFGQMYGDLLPLPIGFKPCQLVPSITTFSFTKITPFLALWVLQTRGFTQRKLEMYTNQTQDLIPNLDGSIQEMDGNGPNV